MATTTNYGWATPNDTDLVKDGASAIRTLGSSIDTSVKSLSPGTTAGDVDYYTAATTKARLGIGTTGQVLTVAAGVPSWSTPASAAPGSGQTRVDTSQTTTSTSYVALATAQSVTLTTGTKVLVVVSSQIGQLSSNPRSVSYSISGATTRAASDTWALVSSTDPAGESQNLTASTVSYQTVTAGSNTFTMLFKVQAGIGTFSNRQIIVIDLGS
jgi:hypothetical protein